MRTPETGVQAATICRRFEVLIQVNRGMFVYVSPSSKPNLADPLFEPSDEQLKQLAHDAFEGVVERHREALKKMREEISALREKVLEDVRHLQ